MMKIEKNITFSRYTIPEKVFRLDIKHKNNGSGKKKNGKRAIASAEEMARFDLFKKVLDRLDEGVYLVDRERVIIFWNKAAERISGYKKKDVEGMHCWNDILMHVDKRGCKRCQKTCLLRMALKDGKPHTTETYLQHKDGHMVPVIVSVIPVFEGDEVVGVFQTFRDNSNKLSMQHRMEELERISMLDQLTNIANRRYIEIMINARLTKLRNYEWHFGVIFFDVDNFKSINDTYGHDAGDLILKMIANTVIRALRPSDIVGRWAGDEFMAVAWDINEKKLKMLAERLSALVRCASVKFGNNKIKTTISVGVALARKRDTLTTLYKKADRMLYKSKQAGKNKVHCYWLHK